MVKLIVKEVLEGYSTGEWYVKLRKNLKSYKKV